MHWHLCLMSVSFETKELEAPTRRLRLYQIFLWCGDFMIIVVFVKLCLFDGVLCPRCVTTKAQVVYVTHALILLQAKQFHKKWMMSPGGMSPKDLSKYTHVRRSDINKGFERIGRSVFHHRTFHC